MYKTIFVDDEILVRESISRIVDWEQCGFELIGVCENGKEAVAFLETHVVDLVITDINMPYMNGLELSRYVFEKCPGTSTIILSGYEDFEFAKKAIQYDVSEYLLKPITSSEFEQALKTLKGKLDQRMEEDSRIYRMAEGYHKYTQNESLISSINLARFVMGTHDGAKRQDELRRLERDLPGKAFRIAAVSVDIMSPWSDEPMEGHQEAALIIYAVENVSRELLAQRDGGVVFRDLDDRVCLLLRGERPERLRVESSELCRQIQQFAGESMGLTLSIGEGAVVSSLQELPASYRGAVDALAFCYTKGEGSLLDSEQIVEETNYEAFESELKVLESSLKAYDDALSEQCVERVMDHIATVYMNRERARAYLILILRTIYETFSQMNVDVQWDERLLTQVGAAANFPAACQLVKGYLEAVRAQRDDMSKSSRQKQAQLALNYIRDHYDEADLTLNALCEHLNISVSYFSSFFKKETGKTFKEVLIETRIEKAKQLLRQTDMRNYEIAEKVGFTDSHYFTILFKKMTGYTPKGYAREHGGA